MLTIETLLQKRTDLSTLITHFTRDTENGTACQNLLSILTEGCLRADKEQGLAANRGFPEQQVVCFTEAPMEVAWTMVQDIQGRRKNLGPYGVVFTKAWARNQGANPVWYIDATPNGRDWLTNDVNRMVSDAAVEETATRILRLTPFFEPMGDWRAKGGVRRDFSWEREWRRVGDLTFSLRDLATVLAPKHEWPLIRKAVAGLDGADTLRFFVPNQSLTERRK